jgi:hypothetical protein
MMIPLAAASHMLFEFVALLALLPSLLPLLATCGKYMLEVAGAVDAAGAAGAGVVPSAGVPICSKPPTTEVNPSALIFLACSKTNFT